uniref:UPF0160 protein-like n=1 Tax=Nicotiana tabacum TaxID=4097 RepID=A0A1S3ZQ56_TOBAC|nr:PREDICTED: UPF0160 protein-like [Nicotiana tabacum]
MRKDPRTCDPWPSPPFSLLRSFTRTCEYAHAISPPQAVDAHDNGINRYDTDQNPKYVINTQLPSRVSRFNLDWNDSDQSPQKENQGFERAMKLAGSEFLESIHYHAKSWLPARSIVKDALLKRKGVDPSGEIVILARTCPWKSHLYELEEELKIDSTLKYVLFQDQRSKDWDVQAVAIAPSVFK